MVDASTKPEGEQVIVRLLGAAIHTAFSMLSYRTFKDLVRHMLGRHVQQLADEGASKKAIAAVLGCAEQTLENCIDTPDPLGNSEAALSRRILGVLQSRPNGVTFPSIFNELRGEGLVKRWGESDRVEAVLDLLIDGGDVRVSGEHNPLYCAVERHKESMPTDRLGNDTRADRIEKLSVAAGIFSTLNTRESGLTDDGHTWGFSRACITRLPADPALQSKALRELDSMQDKWSRKWEERADVGDDTVFYTTVVASAPDKAPDTLPAGAGDALCPKNPDDAVG